MIFDLLGYDRVDVNKIEINPDEAATVQLIFTMYLAGCNPETIASVLNMLGRKKHSHRYKDGRIKEGKVNWTKDNVVNILLNEKRCGHVYAQKTVTPNFLDHKAIKNVGKAQRYYATNHHPAIVRPSDYFLAQRLMAANRGGWKHGLQEMTIYETGILAGGVSTVPNWYGFNAEDYNRAGLRACGIDEEILNGVENSILQNSIFQKNNKAKKKTSNVETTPSLPHVIEIDSDDYENYPKQEATEKPQMQSGDSTESFAKHVKELRDKRNILSDDEQVHNIETCRAEFFSLKEKVCVTFDHLSTSFNKFSFNRLNEGEDDAITDVEMIYNPVEQILIIRKAKEATPKTVNWVKGRVYNKLCKSKK